jgi:multidrug efflux pump
MLGVTVFGLFLTPVFYVSVGRITERFARRRPVEEPASPASPILEGQ